MEENSNIKTISYNSGYTATDGAINKYYKVGPLVIVSFKLAITSPSSDVAFTLPTGYRPLAQINTIAWAYNATILISIESDGRFRIRSTTGGVLSTINPSGSVVFSTT